MEAKEFIAFLERMGWSDVVATQQLGLGSRNTVAKYRREGTPLYIALACAALVRGIAPWPG